MSAPFKPFSDGLKLLYQAGFLHPRNLGALAFGMLRHGFNLQALLYQATRLHPFQTAVCGNDSRTDWQTLYLDSRRYASVLSEYPAWRQRRKTAVLCRNTPESVAVLSALSAGGMPVLLFNADMSTEQLHTLLRQYDPGLLLTDDGLSAKVGGLPFDTVSFGELAAAAQRIETPKPLPRRTAGEMLVLTGGTGGNSRIVRRKTSARISVLPMLVLLKTLRLHQRQNVYIGPPFYHGYGIAALYFSLALRRTMLLTERFDARRAAELITREQAEIAVLVPTMLYRLLDAMPQRGRLQTVLTGSAMLSAEAARRTLGQWGNVLYNLFGTTETGFALMAAPEQLAAKPDSIGRPFPGVTVEIRRADGSLCGIGETGSLWLKTGWSAQSRNHDVCTGDLAKADADGDIFLQGRADDMAVCGGENVYPQDVCRMTEQHPKVRQAAVLVIEHAEYGQALALFAEAEKGLDAAALRLWLAGRLARYQMPQRIGITRELPISEAGKIDRRQLNEWLSAHCERDFLL